MFHEVKRDESFPSLEERVLDLWDRDHSFEKSLSKDQNNETFNFYDGPPFATDRKSVV